MNKRSAISTQSNAILRARRWWLMSPQSMQLIYRRSGYHYNDHRHRIRPPPQQQHHYYCRSITSSPTDDNLILPRSICRPPTWIISEVLYQLFIAIADVIIIKRIIESGCLCIGIIIIIIVAAAAVAARPLQPDSTIRSCYDGFEGRVMCLYERKNNLFGECSGIMIIILLLLLLFLLLLRREHNNNSTNHRQR